MWQDLNTQGIFREICNEIGTNNINKKAGKMDLYK